MCLGKVLFVDTVLFLDILLKVSKNIRIDEAKKLLRQETECRKVWAFPKNCANEIKFTKLYFWHESVECIR